ncbi:hypothetical protein D4764_22G0005680 [Takifugu flavidus]|uniref:Uncharacterized protein n=1 Tax=Takifugu flavidus TaxID=433684 RepID=A0A5C6NEG0_9TELE|nr:hypothetical protein D4764_22G0005680 [Takifugu flavidus]
MSDLTQSLEKEVIWPETQRNHEEISGEKETSNRKEIQLLTERIVQLQQLLSEKEQKTKFFFRR